MLIPKGFLLGFSESGFQFEMGLPGSEDPNSDWWVWVHDHENMLSGVVSGDLPENGPGYWNLYKVDHDLAFKLGMNCARIGVSGVECSLSPPGISALMWIEMRMVT